MSMSRNIPLCALGRVKFPAMIVSLVILAGCTETGSFDLQSVFAGAESEAETSVDTDADAEFTEKDVEAPEVFEAQEAGLWDGRPSLGGVWVAHPDVTEPERVMIRNQANGQFVVGALFRREREIPGPRLQLSSDAAAALGVLAGAPVGLSVVALRKERVAVTPPGPDASQTEQSAAEGGPEVTETTLDAVEAETAPVLQSSLPASSLDKPFVQVGIFSVEDNANRAAQQMQSAGMTPTVRAQETSGKAFWRVLVGPAKTSAERLDLLSKIRGEGFSDAYAVTN